MADMNAGNPEAAEPALQALHARHPENFEIDESLGLLLAGQGNLTTALPLLAAAAKARPHSDVAHANLGTAYLKLGQDQQAAAELQNAARLNPSNAQTREALGQTLMLLKHPREAAVEFNAALAGDGANAALLYNDALALFDSREASRAETLLARMPGADQSAEAQSLYGDVEENLGRYKEAGQHYANAVRLAPTEGNAYMLGIEFLRHWTFEPAAQEFEAGVDQFPDSTRMRFGLGVAYYGGGHYDKAIPVFAELLSKHPGDDVYAELLGRTCIVLTVGSSPECATLLAFSEQHPGNAMIATYMATSILHNPADPQQLQVARQLLDQAIRAKPGLPQAHYAMALWLQDSLQWQQSIPELETAIRLKPDYASAHYRLALAYWHIAQHQRANAEIALHHKYSNQEQSETNARLRSIATLLVSMR